MAKYMQWVEPYSNGNEAVWMLMSFEDVVKARRRSEPRYTQDGMTDQQVLDDFQVINWAQIIDWDPKFGGWNTEKDAAWVAMFNRRVPVENILLECAAGKRPALTPDQCRDLALRLGAPEYQAKRELWKS